MTHIQQRRDQAAVWTSEDPVLFEGEAGHETDTGKWKLGDGVTAWTALPYKSGVDSVAGKTGVVTLEVADVADAAPLESPVFTGSPVAPTPATSDDDTSIATTAFVKAQGYAELDSPALTGSPTAPTAPAGDDDTTIATTEFVNNAAIRPACFATATVLAIPNNAFTDVSGMAKASERGEEITLAGAVFTIPEDGWYTATFTVFWATGTGTRAVQIKKNGSFVVQSNGPAGAEVTTFAYWEGPLVAGDVITFAAFQNSGAPLNTVSVRASIRSEGPAS